MKKREQSNLFLTLDSLVPLDYACRKLDQLLPFSELNQSYRSLYSCNGRKGKGFDFVLRALIIQFMEDLSDREMERYVQENLACKWFCDMDLEEKAPDHSYFGDFRKRLGTSRLMDIFSLVRSRFSKCTSFTMKRYTGQKIPIAQAASYYLTRVSDDLLQEKD